MPDSRANDHLRTGNENPSCLVEGRIYVRYLLRNYPNAKIGVLYQNDDMGKDYLAGLGPASVTGPR